MSSFKVTTPLLINIHCQVGVSQTHPHTYKIRVSHLGQNIWNFVPCQTKTSDRGIIQKSMHHIDTIINYFIYFWISLITFIILWHGFKQWHHAFLESGKLPWFSWDKMELEWQCTHFIFWLSDKWSWLEILEGVVSAPR